MRLFATLAFVLASLLSVVIRAIPAIIYVSRLLWARLREICRKRKLSHFERRQSGKSCRLRHPAFHRPDPLIYSQQYLQQLGLAVTWDNPDIALLKSGVVAPEGALIPNTDYEIEATIWNNSYDAPAVGLGVEFSYYSFGATTTLNPIGSTSVDLGVKGGANHPARARMSWRTPPAGHYCVVVKLVWHDDTNPANNIGQNNVDVVTPQSPAVLKFQLTNDTRAPQRYRFKTDSYVLPAAPACGRASRYRNRDQKWKAIKARHDPAAFPVPPGWTVAITPDAPTLAPDEQIDITVTITPPAGFTGRQPFNIQSVYGQNVLAGGVTVYVAA
jgi:hypothetical protein